MKNLTPEILDYKKSKNKLLSFLKKKENSVMTLATSSNDVVMARPISVWNEALDIYFFTWRYSRKCVQIRNNNKISLCKDNIEIEGTAKILGLITSDKNKEILAFLKQRNPTGIKRWENKPNMVIVKIKPSFACIDGYFINDNAYIEYIDLKKQKAYREKWAHY
jgi:general stress protein 26